MLFVIMTTGEIPGYGGIRGPVLTPQPYELPEVMKLVKSGVDVRLVQENGEYRKITFNDPLLLQAMSNGHKGGVPDPEINIIPIDKEENKEDDKPLTEEEELSKLEQELEELEKNENEDTFEIDSLEEL